MKDLRRTLTSTGNRFGAWLYKKFDGRLSSFGKGLNVLMITTRGRRTGAPRSTCVRFLEVPEGFVVWGTASGARQDPDWFRNLRAAEVAEVQVGPRHLRVRPRELVGEARDATWHGLVLQRVPAVARYARKAGRTIPVAILTPV